jgi:predicted transcriptional regulator
LFKGLTLLVKQGHNFKVSRICLVTIPLKIHYRTLTDLYSHQEQSLYAAYALLKAQCEGLTTKPGFLASKEIKTLSTTFQSSPSTTYSRLNRLSNAGYIKKSKYGYTLTSTTVINNNLTNLTPTKNKKGRYYHPYSIINIPHTNSTHIVELMRMYLLLKQISNRKQYKSNGLPLKTRNRKVRANQNVPERLSVALDYLRQAGKYSSKTVVYNLLKDLEEINLLKITKGKFNNTRYLYYDTNEYELFHLKTAKWNLLNPVLDNKSNISKPVLETKLTHIVKKKKPVLSATEQKFIDFIEVGKSVLVANGFLSYCFLNKKIRKNMIPNVLIKLLSDDQMREIFLTQFKKENVMFNRKCRVAVDVKANIYERYTNEYWTDDVVLVDNDGNWNGGLLTSHSERLLDAYEQRRNERIKTSSAII